MSETGAKPVVFAIERYDPTDRSLDWLEETGVVGLGRIGRGVAQRLCGWGGEDRRLRSFP